MSNISILMPVYNGMPYIIEAIESVLSQEYTDWELIISDNGSTDDTRDYLDTLKDSRIRIYKQPINLGIFGNLNFLLKETQIPIAKILCADDKLMPNALKEFIIFMETYPNCAICRCWKVGDLNTQGPTGFGGSHGDIPELLNPKAAKLMFATFGNVMGNLSTAICRPRLVLEAGGFDQRLPYAGDYEGWFRVAEKHGVAFLTKELVFIRQHEQQSTHLLNRNNELCEQQNSILEYIFEAIEPIDKGLIRTHWTLHFIAPRLSFSIRLLLKGRIKAALKSWRSLPANISALKAAFSYPLWKSKTQISYNTSNKLRARIKELNL